MRESATSEPERLSESNSCPSANATTEGILAPSTETIGPAAYTEEKRACARSRVFVRKDGVRIGVEQRVAKERRTGSVHG